MNERLALRRCKARYAARFAPPKMTDDGRPLEIGQPGGVIEYEEGEFDPRYETVSDLLRKRAVIINHHEDDHEPRYISAAQFLAGLRFKRSDAH